MPLGELSFKVICSLSTVVRSPINHYVWNMFFSQPPFCANLSLRVGTTGNFHGKMLLPKMLCGSKGSLFGNGRAFQVKSLQKANLADRIFPGLKGRKKKSTSSPYESISMADFGV